MSLYNDASLLLIPRGYKSGKVYCQKPTDGDGDLTFTRASSATRVNSDGLVEKVRTNNILQSNDFGNASWSKLDNVLVSATRVADPFGGTTAWQVIYDGTGGGRLEQTVVGLTGISTQSVWLRVSSGTQSVVIGPTSASLTTVTVTTTWTRFSGTAVSGAYPRIQCNSATTIEVYGCQFETGDIATDYIPTTTAAVSVGMTANVPRLDYSQGSCPSLLLEPQRTNNLLRSEEFNNFYWRKSNITITSSTESSPTSDNNSFILQVNNTSGAHTMDLPSGNRISVQSGVTYTSSVFVKKDPTSSNNIIQLLNRIPFFGTSFANFNINTGIVTKEQGCTARIVPLNNGWYRISITATATASGTNDLIVCFTNNNPDSNLIPSYTGSTDERIIIWGAQLEAGAYATSYIPTTTATVTRIADAFTRNNIYTNGLISASGGTWFIELKNNIVYTRDSTARLGIGDTVGLNINAIFLTPLTNGRMQVFKANGGSTSSIYATLTDAVKIAIKWNGTTADLFVNGIKVVSATSFTPTVMENLLNTTNGTPIFIQQMALFNTPLSDTDCVNLTTL
jgi:hypothetical protein